MSFFNAISKWYSGTTTPSKFNSENVVFESDIHRHWTAMFARVIVKFLKKHWQFSLYFLLAVIGLIIQLIKMLMCLPAL